MLANCAEVNIATNFTLDVVLRGNTVRPGSHWQGRHTGGAEADPPQSHRAVEGSHLLRQPLVSPTDGARRNPRAPVAVGRGCGTENLPINCTVPELLRDLFGFPMRDGGHISALAFSVQEIGRARYNSAQASLRRACARLDARELIKISAGQRHTLNPSFYDRTGVQLTEAGITVADALIDAENQAARANLALSNEALPPAAGSLYRRREGLDGQFRSRFFCALTRPPNQATGCLEVVNRYRNAISAACPLMPQ
jgi:hypothetical protein